MPRQPRAVVELIGLDFGLVLLRRGSEWEVIARHGKNPTPGAEFSRTLLAIGCPRTGARSIRSSTGCRPSRSQLGGSIGGRRADPQRLTARWSSVPSMACVPRGAGGATIRPLEAELVQILAASVGTGLARLESEDKAARRHRQFTDFFSPELAAELDRNPASARRRAARADDPLLRHPRILPDFREAQPRGHLRPGPRRHGAVDEPHPRASGGRRRLHRRRDPRPLERPGRPASTTPCSPAGRPWRCKRNCQG